MLIFTRFYRKNHPRSSLEVAQPRNLKKKKKKKKKKKPIIRPNPRLKAKHPYPLRPFFYKYPHPFIYFAFPTLGAGANLLKRVCDHFHLEEVMPYL